MKSPLSPLLFEATSPVQWAPPNPTTSQGRPGIAIWSSASGILHRHRHPLIGEEGLTWAHGGAQIGMDFSNLLLMVKGEWTHTGMDEICFCLMEWRRRGDWWNRGGEPPPWAVSTSYAFDIQPRAPHSQWWGWCWMGRKTTISCPGRFWVDGTIPPLILLLLASINTWIKLQSWEIPPIMVSPA